MADMHQCTVTNYICIYCLQVDVVYVGNLHVQHKKAVLLMFDAGKPVLCEKPLTISSADTAELITAARAKNVFLMEVCYTCVCQDMFTSISEAGFRRIHISLVKHFVISLSLWDMLDIV